MPELVYILCAATSLLCALLLGRSYQRARSRLLMWSMLCFLGLTANNVLLVVDVILVPEIDLSLWRTGTLSASLLLLVAGLIWESR